LLRDDSKPLRQSNIALTLQGVEPLFKLMQRQSTLHSVRNLRKSKVLDWSAASALAASAR
jgi:hypothetical protein